LSRHSHIGRRGRRYARGIRPGERIFYYDDSKNWWSRNGGLRLHQSAIRAAQTPRCSTTSVRHTTPNTASSATQTATAGDLMEIGNNVFMAATARRRGRLRTAKGANIDHGSGLERIAAAAIDNPDTFQDQPALAHRAEAGRNIDKHYDSRHRNDARHSDHLVRHLLAVDGVVPATKPRATSCVDSCAAPSLCVLSWASNKNFLEQIVPVIADLYHETFQKWLKSRRVVEVLVREEKAFRQTLRKGIHEFEKLAKQALTGEAIFNFTTLIVFQ